MRHKVSSEVVLVRTCRNCIPSQTTINYVQNINFGYVKLMKIAKLDDKK